MKAEFAACGVQMPKTFGRLCTMQIARGRRAVHNAKLSSVASALRIPTIANARRAIVDVAVTAFTGMLFSAR